jgi:hypothetical protein
VFAGRLGGALLASLQGTYDLAADLAARDEKLANVTDDEVRAALADAGD